MATFPDIYRIKNVGTGDYLALTSGTPKDPVACSPINQGDKKWLWRIEGSGTGPYKIKNEEYNLQVDRPTYSLKILSNTDGYAFYIEGPETGRKIRSAAGAGTVLQHDKAKNQVLSAKDKKDKQQEWIFETDSENPRPPPQGTYPIKPGKYVIKNVKTGSVIDLEKCIPGDGVKIFGFGANGGLNQQWDVQPSATAPYMTLRCIATDKYARYSNLQEGETLRSSSQSQEYFIIPADKGFYIGPVGKPGYVFDLTGGNVADETPISLLRNHGRDHQKWRFEPA
ncbi:hypothetical protein FRC11_011632 [Ceratobasidium sp. 423]|nr:hypothetical protein FRC11_011632 [Ceratobasidium sp. 423]